jgi:hypothetical protein
MFAVPKGILFRRTGSFKTQARSTDIIAEQPISHRPSPVTTASLESIK